MAARLAGFRLEDADIVAYAAPYNNSFLKSSWKLFHDALQLHCIIVSHNILPRFGRRWRSATATISSTPSGCLAGSVRPSSA